MIHLTLFFDGASRKNPGESGSGWYITSPNQSASKKGYAYTGIKTNNQAEYNGLLNGLKEIKKEYSLKNLSLTIKGDSELIIKQLKGDYKVKSKNLRPYYLEVQKILNEIPNISFEWIPREENRIADHLANQAIDTKSNLLM